MKAFPAILLMAALGACHREREFPTQPVPAASGKKEYDPKYDHSREEKAGGKSPARPGTLAAIGGILRKDDSADPALSDELATALLKKGVFKLVERARLGDLVKEKSLFDPEPERLQRLWETERAELYLAARYRENEDEPSRGKWRMDVKVIDVRSTQVVFGRDVYANTPSALTEAAADALQVWTSRRR